MVDFKEQMIQELDRQWTARPPRVWELWLDAKRNTATIGHVEKPTDEPHLTETNAKPEAPPMKSLNTQIIEELCVLTHEQSVLIGLMLNAQILGELDVSLALKHVARVLKVQARIRKLMEEKGGN